MNVSVELASWGAEHGALACGFTPTLLPTQDLGPEKRLSECGLGIQFCSKSSIGTLRSEVKVSFESGLYSQVVFGGPNLIDRFWD